jgi:hypothetical protein
VHGGDLRRTVAHEVHHCLRMAGPGYGWTLGEALVSEGLAGRFVSRLFGSPSESWECAVSDEERRANLPDNTTLLSTGHDHLAWFFGFGGCHPRWLGYTLGYRIVGDWLDAEARTKSLRRPADARCRAANATTNKARLLQSPVDQSVRTGSLDQDSPSDPSRSSGPTSSRSRNFAAQSRSSGLGAYSTAALPPMFRLCQYLLLSRTAGNAISAVR